MRDNTQILRDALRIGNDALNDKQLLGVPKLLVESMGRVCNEKQKAVTVKAEW